MARMKMLAETTEENAETQGDPDQTFADQPQDDREAVSMPTGKPLTIEGVTLARSKEEFDSLVTEAIASDPWGALDTPVYLPAAFKRGPRADVMQTTPEKIRKAVDAAYADYYDSAEVDSGRTAQFRVVTFPTAHMADAFIKLARRYAQLHPDGRFSLKSRRSKTAPWTVAFAAVPYKSRTAKGGLLVENADGDLGEPPF